MIKHVDKTQQNLDNKTMFKNLLNHYISKLYTSNLVSDILAGGPVAPRVNISVMYRLIGI